MCHHSDYGREQRSCHTPRPDWHHHRGCCCGPGRAPQRFATKEETVEELEECVKQLRAEARRVEERIGELEKEG
ncbi:MAG: hypothetical protein E3J50_02185 [Dehalococcoidia bacterium]|nr:MAG: hypothetical protein E3J50_02185 [Dehalococcoidia bacterium]